MAGRDARPRRGAPARRPQRPAARREQGLIPVLTKAVRDVELAVQRGRNGLTTRSTFQAVALLVREERTRLQSAGLSDARKGEELKRLDGVATVLARTAARDGTLLTLLADDAVLQPETRVVLRELRQAAGIELPEEEPEAATSATANAERQQRRVIPQSVISRQLANPFLEPDYSAAAPPPRRGVLSTWELLTPLLRSFATAPAGARSSMRLPAPGSLGAAGGRELMPHQAQVVAAAAEGHRTFLLADEPGLGKTAQALLAAEAANAYPLLVVVPNVVKRNWAREAATWTPARAATVVQGDGHNVDAYSDIVVVNYEILDRHVAWFSTFGFRGMVIDEAHFIKNKGSQRSQHVLEISRRIRERTARPLLMALTGTPLINDIDDFLAIWDFLGWIDDDEPSRELMAKLEEAGLTPVDHGFSEMARSAVVDMGIVRRRKVDVAADIPARRIADVPVDLDGAIGRSIREAERVLARRMLKRYDSAWEAQNPGIVAAGIDRELVRKVATWERRDSDEDSGVKDGENVFTMMRRIGQAKAALAADYAAQLSRSAGKVVLFAKHIDVMDAAEDTFEQRGIGYRSVRGNQTPKARQEAIDSFTTDPEVEVIVCSLTAAGVGINLQVSSNVVLAELSWTAAEQTQAIDRVHRIGQDQPVTAWRIIAAQTIDARIAELLDDKALLAARALDGSGEEVTSSVDIQLEALVTLLTDALEERAAA